MTRRPFSRRRRADGAEPTTSAAPADPAAQAPGGLAAPAPTAAGGDASAAPLPLSDATAVHPPAALPDGAAPAGLEPHAVGTPGFRDRGRLRRRLRLLRRLRELGFRDVGGLVLDLHRFGRENAELVTTKLTALAALDAELRALEAALDDRREFVVLREPGVAACPRCAALHGSDANFCPNCGLGFDGPQAVAGTGVVGSAVAAPPRARQDPGAGAAAAAGSAPLPGVPPTPAAPTEADGDAGAEAGTVRVSEAGATPVSSRRGASVAEPGTGEPPPSPDAADPGAAGEPPHRTP